ncbi:Ig-like domain-containing protein [Dryocola clanedunensis]|uniref:Ig-like domain-containing protein n=1 Tax=Cedecea sulfonylureivorans TaxID=3051154 RepID=UPI001925D095|nr:Ig-like domain-containing protein [Cedecea sulfonylureivorans]
MSDSDNKDKNGVAAVGNGDFTSLITIDSITDNTGLQQGPVSNGGMTDDLQPTLSGYVPYADSGGLIVRVYLNSVPVGSAVVQPGGNWTFTPDTPLAADTSNYFQVVLLDPGGGSQLRFSDPYYINTTAPDQDTPINVVLDNVSDNVQGGITGALVNGDVTNDARPDLSGHASAGATVNVYDNNVLIGSTTAAADGSWALTPAENLADGTHNLSVTAVSTTGESASTDGFTLTVDTQIAAPVLTAIVDNVGDYQSDVLNDGKTDDKQPLLTGTGEPGSHIAITMYGPQTQKIHTIATVTVGEDGTWNYQFTGRQAMQSGDNVFHITGTDAAGNVLAGEDFTVQLTGSNQDAPVPDAPVITTAYDDVGSSQGFIHSGATTDDTAPLLQGQAEAGSVVKVYDNGAVMGSTTANSSGSWSYTTPARSEGKHTFTATATDAAGNASGKSGDFVVNIDVPDTTAPAAPVITNAYDDVGVQKGDVANGDKTDDSLLKFSGTAEANSLVTISHIVEGSGKTYIDGTAVSDATGHWTFQMSNSFIGSSGNRNFTATATDAAGNKSPASDSYVVNYVGSNQDAPYTSGIEQFGDATNEHGYSFVTAQGVEVTSTVEMLIGGAPLGLTNGLGGNTYLQTSRNGLDGEVHVTLPGAANTVTISASSNFGDGSINAGAVTFYNAAGNVIEVTSFSHPTSGQQLTLDVMTATAANGEAIASFTIHDAAFVGGVEWGAESSPVYTSGIEQFGDAANEHGYSFVTAQGVEVTSTVEMLISGAPLDLTNGLGGNTYLQTTRNGLDGEVHITLPGVANTVTISASSNFGDGSINAGAVTFYNAAGNVIEVTSSTHPTSGQQLALDVMTATAANGEAIASFTIHDAVYVGGVQWESAATTTYSLQQDMSDVNTANGGDDAMLLSTVDDKAHMDITDHSQNTLQLSLNDILSEAHDNLFIQDGNKQLAVTGDAGDVVELKVEDLAHNTWQDAGQVTAGGVQYDVYQHAGSNVELLVQQGVELHQVS